MKSLHYRIIYESSGMVRTMFREIKISDNAVDGFNFDLGNWGKIIAVNSMCEKTDWTYQPLHEGDILRFKKDGLIYILEYDTVNAKWCAVQPRKDDGNLYEGIYSGGVAGQDLARFIKLGNIYENYDIIENLKPLSERVFENGAAIMDAGFYDNPVKILSGGETGISLVQVEMVDTRYTDGRLVIADVMKSRITQ